MRTISSAALALGTLLLCACAANPQKREIWSHLPGGGYQLIVMQPDVTAGQLTAGGVFEPREEWTNQARTSVVQALQQHFSSRGATTRVAASAADAGWDAAKTQELLELHRAVGAAIETHYHGPVPLPTKKDQLDWTLGEQAVAFGAATHYDYALFVRAQDSFASGGRVALQVAGFLGCLAGICVLPMGGAQIAFASLVDLKTGKVIWFNRLLSFSGDMRTPQGADEAVAKLLGTVAPSSATERIGP
jgi:hypothetical protein